MSCSPWTRASTSCPVPSSTTVLPELHLRPGRLRRARWRLHAGDARFEGCTFNRCDFRYFIGFTVDIVDCTFIDTIKSARFGRSMARLEPLVDGMSESFAP